MSKNGFLVLDVLNTESTETLFSVTEAILEKRRNGFSNHPFIPHSSFFPFPPCSSPPLFAIIHADECESRSHRQAGKFPALGEVNNLAFVLVEVRVNRKIREISVFVDESGSFAPESADPKSRYYLLCLVAHDQDVDITPEISKLEDELDRLGLGRAHCIHAGPLIRREDEYVTMTREERRGIFQRMLIFARSVHVLYKWFAVDKHQNSKNAAIHDALLQKIVEFLIAHRDEFANYDKLKIYYDNGQSQVLSLLKEAFAIYASKTDFVPAVKPERYRLFQAADLACTLALVQTKLEAEGKMTHSENAFFGGEKQLRKVYLKPIERKEWL